MPICVVILKPRYNGRDSRAVPAVRWHLQYGLGITPLTIAPYMIEFALLYCSYISVVVHLSSDHSALMGEREDTPGL